MSESSHCVIVLSDKSNCRPPPGPTQSPHLGQSTEGFSFHCTPSLCQQCLPLVVPRHRARQRQENAVGTLHNGSGGRQILEQRADIDLSLLPHNEIGVLRSGLLSWTTQRFGTPANTRSTRPSAFISIIWTQTCESLTWPLWSVSRGCDWVWYCSNYVIRNINGLKSNCWGLAGIWLVKRHFHQPKHARVAIQKIGPAIAVDIEEILRGIRSVVGGGSVWGASGSPARSPSW